MRANRVESGKGREAREELEKRSSSVAKVDGIVVADGGDTQVCTMLGIGVSRPAHQLSSGPFGCLGVATPMGTMLSQLGEA